MRRVSSPALCRNHHFLPADLDLWAFRVGGLVFAAFGAPLALRFTGPAVASSPVASPSAEASAGAGFRFAFRTLAVMVGDWPSVRISVIRTNVNSGRKPRLRREFFRRRFLNAM